MRVVVSGRVSVSVSMGRWADGTSSIEHTGDHIGHIGGEWDMGGGRN